MSFFSGFMLGQAMNGRNNSGGLAVGLFGIIAFAFMLLVIWATVGSFFLPLYSILHFAVWGYEFGNEMMSLLAVIAMALIVPAAYAMALLGTRREFYVGAAILDVITFTVMYSLILFEGTPLHEIKELYEDDEHLTNTFIATLLCIASVFGIRFLFVRYMSQERRSRNVRRALAPLRGIAFSRIAAWMVLGVSALFTAASVWRFRYDHNRIHHFMEEAGRSYDEAFQFVYYGNTYQEDLTIALVSATLAVLAIVHIVFLHRRRRQSAANNDGQPQAAR